MNWLRGFKNHLVRPIQAAFLKSIRFKIILLYSLILTVTLLAFNLFVFEHFKSILSEKMDSILLLKAKSIDQSIQNYWTTNKSEAKTLRSFLNKSKNYSAANSQQLTFDQLSQVLDLNKMDVSLFDKDGAVITSNQWMYTDSFSQPKVKYIQHIFKDEFQDVVIFSGQTAAPVRNLFHPVFRDKKLQLVVAVTASLAPLKEELWKLKKGLLLRVPFFILIASLAAFLLVKATLSPVEEMMATIHQITPDKLNIRLKIPRAEDEISRLAKTFNSMLSELEKSFTAQRQMIEDISHELKTPLTVLRGQLEVELRKTRTIKEYKHVLISNYEEIKKIKTIIDHLMLLAKLDNQQLILEKELLNLNLITQGAIHAIEPFARTKNIEINFIEQENAYIIADPQCIQLAIECLLDNSVKFTMSGQSVNVEIKVNKTFLSVQIEDRGIGIDAGDLPFIFDRFYKIDKARSLTEGFGLGLCLAQSIVKVHGGRIKVSSEKGEGSIFVIDFPVDENSYSTTPKNMSFN